ncbi:hypothetical protein [Candidatus Protochlamydia phocaeensis]|uniref:hypothetical protein n=1 Tax=Candidatus Protochlamydia phocaeensis TaxID=1414722 RepID=UPI000838B544|nr:hypothetical protein [Candidatus Protochlamydia phocaeensis]
MPSDTIQTSLSSIGEYLNQAGYETIIQPPTEMNASEQLLVSLGQDVDGHPLVLHLFWTQGIEREPDSADTESIDFLQFLLVPSFLATEAAMKDLTSLILNLNATLDMAGFGLYESERLVYYRYVHICEKPMMAAEPVLAVVVSIEFLIEMILPSLREVALGHKSLSQIQQEAVRNMQEDAESLDL